VSVQRELREELESSGGSRGVTGRWLRDRFGYPRLTGTARRQIGAALESEGIRAVPRIEDIGADDVVQLQVVARLRWWKRPVGLGLRVWQVSIALAGVAATLVALYTFARDEIRAARPPEPLSGDINFVVSDFRTASSEDSSRGRALALAVYESLRSRLTSADETVRAAGRGPTEVESVEGDSEADRARSAAHIAREHNADVVVHGDLRTDQLTTSIAPEFYISPELLDGGEELAGPHQFGAPIEVRGSIDASVTTRRALREQVIERAGALAELLIGLGDFAAGDLARAQRRFRAASAAGEQGVAHLFLGNTELRLGNLAAAERAYKRALAVSPEYGRARFGLAEVGFQAACAAPVDHAGVLSAIDDYRAVLGAELQPHDFPMRVKTNLGLGKAQLCLAPPRCAIAQRHFQAVIDDYEARRSALRDETAEAWGGIGVALELCADRGRGTGSEHAREAADRYRRAATLTTDPSRAAYYSSLLAEVLLTIDDVDGAVSAYRRAIELEPSADLRRSYRIALRRQMKQ
jgi:tetratricopeptide (TPR) repeat protein